MKHKKESINVALIDLNHMTLGVHTNTIPLGIGGIAYYLKSNVAYKFDIRLFKNPNKFLNVLKKWKCDVLGITQYAWNSELNLYMAQFVKKNNPDCIVVAGGPNQYISHEDRFAYLKKYDFIDYCVNFDGEIPFSEIVRRFIQGEKKEDMCRYPIAGAYYLNAKKTKLVESTKAPPRLTSLDVFKSIYAEGFFDELLDQGFHPFLQTQRGCPFKCTYCHTGNDYCSKVIFQSLEFFNRDLEYLGKRFAGQHNVTLYMANTNFGLFKQDLEIARAIRRIQDKYDWPKNININSGSNLNRLLDVLSILKYKFMPVNSLQTLTPKVLKNIKRKNVPLDNFVAFQKKVTQYINEYTATELILCLPGETKKSFLKTISLVLNSGVQNIVIFTLMVLRGIPIASRNFARQHGHIIRYRVVPRCFSEISGRKIFEFEKVVVGTKFMPFEDYIKLRGLSLIIAVFASSLEMFPLRKFMMQYKINIASWIFAIYDRIFDSKNLFFIYNSFLQETKDELFLSKEALLEFFNKKENYNLLCRGKFGDNVIRKYKTIMLSEHYKDCLQIAFLQLRYLLKQSQNLEGFDPLLKDLESYLKTRDVGHVFKEGYDDAVFQDVTLSYDIPSWLASENENVCLADCKGSYPYTMIITDYMRNRLNTFRQMNRNSELSVQVLYRDGYTRDFWPLWKPRA